MNSSNFIIGSGRPPAPPPPMLIADVPVVQLLTEGEPIAPPQGIVYSTSPKSWIGDDGHSYVVKGPEPNEVIPEAIAYQLAKSFGLFVPDFALGRRDGVSGHMFSSRKAPNVIRNVEPWLRSKRYHPADMMPAIVLFDIWIANTDRNIGNLIGRRAVEGSHGDIEIVAIDFEKAVALRGPHTLMSTAQVSARSCVPGPGQTLGVILGKPAFTEALMSRFRSISDDVVRGAVHGVRNVVGDSFAWADSIIAVLIRRRDAIRALATEALK